MVKMSPRQRVGLVALATAVVLFRLGAAVAPAHADGLNLSWDNCGASGAEFRTFACDTNTGQSILVGSVVPPAGFNAINGAGARLELSFTGATIPDWWRVRNSGACRDGSASVSFVASGTTGCADHWLGAGFGGFGSYSEYISPNHWRLTLVCGIPDQNAQDWLEGVEVFLFKVAFDHHKTTGTGSCTGCEIGTDIAFTWLQMSSSPPASIPLVTWPAGRNTVRWNGGFTPTRSTTWGQIKTLYR